MRRASPFLEYHERPGTGPLVVMIECPACGADLRGKKTAAHLASDDHGPEDFGLTAGTVDRQSALEEFGLEPEGGASA